MRTRTLGFAFAVAAVFGTGCIGKSEYQKGPETVPGAKKEAGPPTPGMVKGKPVQRCGSPPVPATDGLLDDFEDGNNQLTNMAGRDGYWWVSVDKAGSKFTIPAQGFERVARHGLERRGVRSCSGSGRTSLVSSTAVGSISS